MEPKRSVSIIVLAILLSVGATECSPRDEDLVAEETSVLRDRSRVKNHKYSSVRTENEIGASSTEPPEFGLRTVSVKRGNAAATNDIGGGDSTTEIGSDFRTRKKLDPLENEIASAEKKKDMATAGSANGKGKQKKETSEKKEDDDEEKTLAQQVADGKYGLIQNEIFPNGSKRPGILSYLSNSEVPKDTKENLGGLEKDEIWLAEDHVLVLRGGRYPEKKDDEKEPPSSPEWPPIDDYSAPTRQVKIPENPKIPPPFPVRLRENGPLEFVGGGENRTSGVPPFFPPFPPPFPFRPNDSLPFPFPVPFPRSPDEAPNGTFPFPFPPGPLPQFPGNFPPGAAFLPPPGNLTDFDEDDPSIYYPPKYDFYYPVDNSTAVPPGPLVPGIILPPPPDFFAPLENETDTRAADEENETDGDFKSSTETPYVGPDYLPVPRKPPFKHRAHKRPSTVSEVYSSPSPRRPDKQTVSYVYPENVQKKQTTPSPFDSFRTTKVADSGSGRDERLPEGFTSPIYVPDGGNRYVYHPLPTTSPKPNHITIPTTKALTKEIYIVTTPEADNQNRIEDSYRSPKPSKQNKYESLSPEIHPLRSLIRPNVSVSYVGKYGHLPASTPFPYPKRTQDGPARDEGGAIRGGHYITRAPNFEQNLVTTPVPTVGEITVTPVPVVKKIRIRPVVPESSDSVTPSTNPSKATFYFYEEPPVTTENPSKVSQKETSTEKPRQTYVEQPQGEPTPSVKYYYPSPTFGKTPIRQFLEETFHSSNVLPNKPQISHVDHSGIIKHGYYSPDVPKMKHLNYGGPVPTKPVKYHYVTDEESVTIPHHKIKALEVENSGSSGLQSVQPSKSNLQPYEIRRPQTQPSTTTTTHRPEKTTVASLVSTTVSVPLDYRNTDPPFVPSNYYATARPENLHFTPQDHTFVDEITKNYFTIFGQKINSASTTPLAPIKRPVPNPIQPYRPVQPYRPLQPVPVNPVDPDPLKYYKGDKNKFLHVVTTSPRPHSNFEQYLKEITGEDHKEYIVTNVYPTKTKKGKGFLPGDVPPRLHHPDPVFLQPLRQVFLQNQTPPPPPSPPPGKNRYPYRGLFAEKPSYVYGPVFSTTLRPVVDVEIRPQYLEHVSSTSGPYESIRRPPENLRYNHNFGQYLREITNFGDSPTTPRPLKIQTDPHLDYFSTTPSPANQIDYSPTRYPPPEATPKPPSLEGDILINYKPQRPEINPEAETIDPASPVPAFASGSNFQIVDPPDLSLHRNRVPYRATYDPKTHGFDAAKDFFENLPKSGYFSPSHGSTGNSFISYNLPGNGGHFYFLTPQIVDKFRQQEEERPEPDRYRTVKRNEDRTNRSHLRKGSESRYPSQNTQTTRHGYSTPDYFRRRRKKP